MKTADSSTVCSLRMAWLLVMFDISVVSHQQPDEASGFRNDLIADGYMRVQFSVYARPCGSTDRVDTHVRRLKKLIPKHGEVRGLIITDAQWGRMLIMRAQKKQPPEEQPEQLMFF